MSDTETAITPGGNPVCADCGRWYGLGDKHECMTTQTLTLTDFLLARIAEEDTGCAGDAEYQSCYQRGERFDEVLAAIKRAVALTTPMDSAYGWEDIQMTFGLLYADHPDYREEWRP